MIISTALKFALAVACSSLALGIEAAVVPLDLNNFPSLLDATLAELRYGLDFGLYTSVNLTTVFIERIKEVTNDLRPVTEINPDALSIAAKMDAEREEKKTVGDLHGIPVLIEDNMATLDKMNTTAGSYALVGAVPKEESTVVAKLRKAGAIILGKTNMSEWGATRSVNTTNGWSAYGGQTKGSAVASSIGLAWASLGTETDGSLWTTASANNVVAIKPTVGLTSRYMVIPVSERQDSVGPIARTVKDAAYLLAAIAGRDTKDTRERFTPDFPFEDGKLPSYVAACKKDGLRGKRIGVLRHPFGTSAQGTKETKFMYKEFSAALETLASAGAVIVRDIDLPGEALLSANNRYHHSVSWYADLKGVLGRYYLELLQTNPANVKSLKDVVQFTHPHPKEEYPTRDTEMWDAALQSPYDNNSAKTRESRRRLRDYGVYDGVIGALQNSTLDAIAVPTTMMPRTPAVIGSPFISVPLGKLPHSTSVILDEFGALNVTAPNAPFGLNFLGTFWGEETLIEIAYAFEQETMAREKIHPYIEPRTEMRDVVGKQ
ncbi:hypothetical protein EsHS_00007077 [Epichloe bromicola]